MTRLVTVLALMTVALVPAPARGQQPAPKPLVPLDVEVVLARYQGERKISSIPYVLNVNANGERTTMVMGTEVPIVSTTFTPSAQGGASPQPLRSYNYRNVGTTITLGANTVEGGFTVLMNIEDSSVFSPDARQQPGMPLMPDVPVFRSFKGQNSVLLRDGQTRQFTVATDRVTGEVLKAEVSLKVAK